jgi:TIR domain
MPPEVPQYWDFFIIHSSRETELASQLYVALRDDFAVFFDRESIPLGATWDEHLFQAMMRTRCFLVLISSQFEEAQIAREEYQIAINLRRQSPETKSVVPITSEARALLPYGLGIFQGLDFRRDGGLAGVVGKLKSDFSSAPPGSPTSTSTGKPATPAHALHDYPRRGRVPPELVTEILITAFASLHDPLLGPSLGLIFVDKANAFRKEADPDDPSVTIIETWALPPVAMVAPLVFWRSLLTEARLHSPRMLAAVLMTANTNTFSKPAWKDHQSLMNYLRALPS